MKDGIKYLPHYYVDELQLENFVRENINLIFGEDAIFFEKTKIRSISGIGTITDGFVLHLPEKKWYILEVELARHPLFEHIVTQVSKFNSAIKNSVTKQKLINAFFKEIKENPQMNFKVESSGIQKEIHKFLTDLINNNPEVAIIIDERTEDLTDVCNALPFVTNILEFKTYCRENVGIEVPIHIFDTLCDYKTITSSKKSSTKSTSAKPRGKGEPFYAEEKHLIGIPSDIRELYDKIKALLLSLGDNIKIKPTKFYIGFISKTNFVDVRVQKKALKVWFNLPQGKLNDPKQLTRDVSKVGHWGNGDYELHLYDDSELEYVIDLAKQSYKINSK